MFFYGNISSGLWLLANRKTKHRKYSLLFHCTVLSSFVPLFLPIILATDLYFWAAETWQWTVGSSKFLIAVTKNISVIWALDIQYVFTIAYICLVCKYIKTHKVWYLGYLLDCSIKGCLLKFIQSMVGNLDFNLWSLLVSITVQKIIFYWTQGMGLIENFFRDFKFWTNSPLFPVKLSIGWADLNWTLMAMCNIAIIQAVNFMGHWWE